MVLLLQYANEVPDDVYQEALVQAENFKNTHDRSHRDFLKMQNGLGGRV